MRVFRTVVSVRVFHTVVSVRVFRTVVSLFSKFQKIKMACDSTIIIIVDFLVYFRVLIVTILRDTQLIMREHKTFLIGLLYLQCHSIGIIIYL